MTPLMIALRSVYWPTVVGMGLVLLWLAERTWGADVATFGLVYLILFAPTTWAVLLAVVVRATGRAPNDVLTGLTTIAGIWTSLMVWKLVA
jgi:hypothetical protein